MKTSSEIKPSLKANPTGNQVMANMESGGAAMPGGLEHMQAKAIVQALRIQRKTKGVYSG